MRTLVLGYGNPGRGDDGLGPVLIERLAERVDDSVTLLTAIQLQPEHIFDLQGHDRILLVDAGLETPAPFHWERLQPRRDASAFSHALSPWALLAIHVKILNVSSPAAFLLTIRGECFELGESLSPLAQTYLQQALDFVITWLADVRAVAG